MKGENKHYSLKSLIAVFLCRNCHTTIFQPESSPSHRHMNSTELSLKKKLLSILKNESEFEGLLPVTYSAEYPELLKMIFIFIFYIPLNG